MAVDTVKKVKEVLGSNDYGANAAQQASEPGIINKIMGFEGLAGKNAKIPTVTEIMGFNGVGQPTDAQKYPQKTTAVPKQQPVAPAPSTQQTVPVIAGGKPPDTPTTLATSPVNQNQGTAVQPIAGNDGIKFDAGKQIPFTGNASALIAGKETEIGGNLWTRGNNGKPYQLTGKNADGTTFDNRVSLKSAAQIGHEADLAQIAKTGRTVAEQHAAMQQIQKDHDRYQATTMSPRERAAFEAMNNSKLSSGTRSAAAAEVEAFKARRDAFLGKEKNEQAQAIAGMTAKTEANKAAQHLAGVQYNADAHVKAAEIAGGAAVKKSQQEAKNKSADQKQKDTTALQQKVYDQITKGYDFTGISPTAVHDYATTMAKTAGKGYVTLADPTGTHGDVIVHPGVAEFANQHLKSVKTPDQYVRLLQELDKVAAGGIHRTGIKSTQQLKPLKVSPNQIAGMTEQG